MHAAPVAVPQRSVEDGLAVWCEARRSDDSAPEGQSAERRRDGWRPKPPVGEHSTRESRGQQGQRGSARNGFYWWEFDLTYYVIWGMQALGLAWDVQPVPERVYREAREGPTFPAPASVPATRP